MEVGLRDGGRSVDEWIALVRLTSITGVGDRIATRLIRVFGSARAVFDVPEAALREFVPPRVAAARRSATSVAEASRTVDEWLGTGYALLSFVDRGYPNGLRELLDPPPLLFARGDLSSLSATAIGIVGTRNPTAYGVRSAGACSRAACSRKVVVVSGMATGIDTEAHRGALEAGGRTIAVLGCGLDRVYPRTNDRLSRSIAANGLLLTEFRPGTLPRAHHFPRRNRIIAGLSRALVVVEAGVKSGALITVDHMLNLGREVFVVPGPIDRPESRGANLLIAQGARPLTSVTDFETDLDALGLSRDPVPRFERDGSAAVAAEVAPEFERPVWDALAEEGSTVDQVVRRIGSDSAAVLGGLTRLELEGWVSRTPEGRYRRDAPLSRSA